MVISAVVAMCHLRCEKGGKVICKNLFVLRKFMCLCEATYDRFENVRKKFPFSQTCLGETPFWEASYVRHKMQRSAKQCETLLKQNK